MSTPRRFSVLQALLVLAVAAALYAALVGWQLVRPWR